MGSKERYNIKEREEHWRKFWEKGRIYRFDSKSKKPVFSVDTPPPYVSADHLHAGHIMSYSQAEFMVRYKRMKGYNVFYPMGFDDNGLPTERFVEKKYKIDKNKVSRSEFIKKCLKETKRGAENYKNLWTLLGISVDWSKTYSTINEHCRKISQWSFLDLYKKKKIVRKSEPIHWCTRCQTALAQADLEDREVEGIMNYIKFSLEDNTSITIATTRPELIPACVALFFNPKDKRYTKLKGKKAIIPLLNYEIPILEDKTVDPEKGTGLMMVCTFGDSEDICKWKEYKLDTRIIFNKEGKLNEKGGKYEGLSVSEARKKIIEDLKKNKLVEKEEKITHTLNVHERCETPIEFITTKQWFIDVLGVKKDLLKRGEKLNWFPKHMKKRYDEWVDSLKWDWCISRQRYFGVPLPVWYCDSCKEVILPKEKDLPVDPTEDKPPIKECPKCKSKIIPEKNVMDTWMTSSMTPVIGAKLVEDKKMQGKLYPSTLRPQAFDIIRTWLFYTIVKSHYHHNSLPFKDAMISGLGLDAKGKKISKRFGNFTDPVKIINQWGADALRYWATGTKLGENMRYSEEEIRKGKRTVTKLWNAAKFCSISFEKSDPKKTSAKLHPEDKWILGELYKTIGETEKNFEKYEYSKARNATDSFFWNTFTDNYLEFVKHRIYGDDKESQKAVNVTLYKTFLAIAKMYAPIMPFITEEIYQKYFKKHEKSTSIHMSEWPKAEKSWKLDKNLEDEFSKVLKIVEEVRKYKSENSISLGKEINEFKTSSKLDKKYMDFLIKALRVKRFI